MFRSIHISKKLLLYMLFKRLKKYCSLSFPVMELFQLWRIFMGLFARSRRNKLLTKLFVIYITYSSTYFNFPIYSNNYRDNGPHHPKLSLLLRRPLVFMIKH